MTQFSLQTIALMSELARHIGLPESALSPDSQLILTVNDEVAFTVGPRREGDTSTELLTFFAELDELPPEKIETILLIPLQENFVLGLEGSGTICLAPASQSLLLLHSLPLKNLQLETAVFVLERFAAAVLRWDERLAKQLVVEENHIAEDVEIPSTFYKHV